MHYAIMLVTVSTGQEPAQMTTIEAFEHYDTALLRFIELDSGPYPGPYRYYQLTPLTRHGETVMAAIENMYR
jgi:hypothetical protein